jgi:hypothetical protein
MFIMALLLSSVSISHAVPVWNGDLAPADSVKGGIERCNRAVIRHISAAMVRAGPGRNFKIVGHLQSGATVFTCNEAFDQKRGRDRRWDGVAYRGGGKLCNGASKVGLPIELSKGCKTGWVEDKQVDVLTG